MTTFLLPGMGASSEMYPSPWTQLPSVEFLNWPQYRGEKTLTEVARRLIDEASISRNDTIGGSSLGGMVALEIAHALDCKEVFLIGSAVSRHELNPFLQMATPLAKISPIRLAQILAGKSSGPVGAMFRDSDTEFVRAMCIALASWESPPYPSGRIRRIHGSKDLTIPAPPGVEVIQGAGHLLAHSHAQECVDWFTKAPGRV